MPLNNGRAGYEYWIIPLTHGWAYNPPPLKPWELGPKAAELASEMINELVSVQAGGAGKPVEASATSTKSATPRPMLVDTARTSMASMGSKTGTHTSTQPPREPSMIPLIAVLIVVLIIVIVVELILAGAAKGPSGRV